jgi:hypothetical protein
LAWAEGQTLTLTQIVNEVLHTQHANNQQEPFTDQHIPSVPELPTGRVLTAVPWS